MKVYYGIEITYAHVHALDVVRDTDYLNTASLVDKQNTQSVCHNNNIAIHCAHVPGSVVQS